MHLIPSGLEVCWQKLRNVLQDFCKQASSKWWLDFFYLASLRVQGAGKNAWPAFRQSNAKEKLPALNPTHVYWWVANHPPPGRVQCKISQVLNQRHVTINSQTHAGIQGLWTVSSYPTLARSPLLLGAKLGMEIPLAYWKCRNLTWLWQGMRWVPSLPQDILIFGFKWYRRGSHLQVLLRGNLTVCQTIHLEASFLTGCNRETA